MPKRRANERGNIRKRKDGRWEGRYTAGYDPESGKRIIKNVLGKTQAEVKEKLKAAISGSHRLDVSKQGTYPVSSVGENVVRGLRRPRIRPNTKAYYTNYIENHIIPGIGNISLDKLTTIQIQRFYNNLQKTGRVQRKNFPPLKGCQSQSQSGSRRSHAAAQLLGAGGGRRLISPIPLRAANCRSSRNRK